MKFQFMHEHRKIFALYLMARLLGVSRSGFNRWNRHGGTTRTERDLELSRKNEDIHRSSRGTYGSPRILAQLRAMGIRCSKRRVERLMRENGIRSRTKRKFRITTDSKHSFPVAQNILARDFSPHGPNQSWAADITYLQTDEGWLFLAVVIDLFSRQVIGWSMDERITRQLTLGALQMAYKRRGSVRGVVHHSDRGSQYACGDYRRLLGFYGAICSMSRKGNCWDNAVVESFFHTLKTEFVHHERFANREVAKRKIFEWIEVFYNRQRIHSALGYVTPAQYEAKVA